MSDDDRPAEVWHATLDDTPSPPGPAAHEEPPGAYADRETTWVADHTPQTRDTTPALGAPGGPASWRRGVQGARVALQRRGWADAQWSYLYGRDTGYAGEEPAPGQVAAANRRMREEVPAPEHLHGPFIKPPVWTWEIPVYFWFGGIAAGSSFVALACDLAGDHRSAATARKVALAAVMPSPPLLIADLGRPARFLNMLRIFKPRSPMNLGAWSLMAFSVLGSAAVGADLLGHDRAGRRLGVGTAAAGSYLGSYTGVLLAATAVPVWARSRLLLGPIFVCTAAATGAAATRLTLVATGLPEGHPTRSALGTIETGAMLCELVLSSLNERRLGRAGHVLHQGRPGAVFKAAKWTVRGGLALRFARRRLGVRGHNVASVMYLLAGLGFRYAWVEAGKASARDDEAVALMHRGDVTLEDRRRPGAHGPRTVSQGRAPLSPDAGPLRRAWTEGVRRASLLAEGLLSR